MRSPEEVGFDAFLWAWQFFAKLGSNRSRAGGAQVRAGWAEPRATLTLTTDCVIKIRVFQKYGWFRSELCPKLSTIFSERTTLRSLYAIADPSVCRLSSVVCLSVTLVRPTQPVEIFGNFFSPYDSPGTLLF